MRPPPTPVTRLSLALPPPLADELRSAARDKGITVNAAITTAVEQWIAIFGGEK